MNDVLLIIHVTGNRIAVTCPQLMVTLLPLQTLQYNMCIHIRTRACIKILLVVQNLIRMNVTESEQTQKSLLCMN